MHLKQRQSLVAAPRLLAVLFSKQHRIRYSMEAIVPGHLYPLRAVHACLTSTETESVTASCFVGLCCFRAVGLKRH